MKYKKGMKAIDVGIIDNNEYQFTWRQHYLPLSCMKRFCTDDKRINVINKRNAQVNYRKLRGYEVGAVSARAWTQSAEKDFFLSIETPYFELSKRLCEGLNNLSDEDHQTFTNYICLWGARFQFRINDQKAHFLNGISVPELSQREIQNLEQKGASVGGVIQPYEFNSLQVQRTYTASRIKLGDVKWQIYRLVALDCILPDTTDNTLVLPIAPNIVVLPAGAELDVMSTESISSLNLQLINGCAEYYYAKDISRLVYY